MFELVKTFCKMASKEKALEHAAMTIKSERVKESGVEHTDKHGWRSWFITEQWAGDKTIEEIEEKNK